MEGAQTISGMARAIGPAAAAAEEFPTQFAPELGVVELGLAKVGLRTPARRFAAGALLTTGALWAIKPSALFDESGKPREWSATSAKATGTTMVPWFVYPLAVGVYMSLFL